ncbi:MAG: class I SAM-dependent methyltransferase [Anaerolineales bacterium]|nr:class I SAM-dependent methyltransferase [Anaerolineales bacterium]
MSQHPPICDYEGSDYQTSFWEQGGRAYEDRAEAIALRRLLPSQGELLLEIGAGAGRNTLRYQGYARIVLMDYSLTQLQQAQARLGRDPRFTYVAADVYRLPFAEAIFDGATMIRVLHHIAEPRQALHQIRRVLQPQAVFILEYANKQNLKAILRFWLGRQAWSPFEHQPVEFVPLNFDFHPQAVRQWLQQAGFELQRQLTVSHFRLGPLKRLFPARLLAGLDGLAQLTGDWWQLSPSVFTRSQAVGEPTVAVPGTFFRCPACDGTALQERPAVLHCSSCGKDWPVVAGIYDFRDRP